MNGLVQVLRSLGAARLAVMGVVGVGVIAFFIFMAARFSQPQLALLYGGLDLDDSAAIVSQLESLNVPFELRGNGGEILVPKDQVLKLRMNMAQEGLPTGGSIGWWRRATSQPSSATRQPAGCGRRRGRTASGQAGWSSKRSSRTSTPR